MAKYINRHGKTPKAICEAFRVFNRIIIDSILDIVPAVKPQIAMYEAYGAEGIAAYIDTCEYAASKGLAVIGDVKRGDISSTASAYAAHLKGVDILGDHFDLWHEDFITVNPYLGTDGIRPFTEACAESGKGIFVLVKTSNPSSADIQDKRIGEDSSVAPLYRQVACYAARWGEELIGEYGYSAVGAVVGATHRDVGIALRREFPHMFFLVPGYGAQGADAEDVKNFFDKDGRGCIVNSSRGIIGAWAKDERGADGAAALSASESEELLSSATRAAALRMRDELRGVLWRKF
jgi:orotidine-5'-phosphate decarboxylase